jgi:hypothetical protein
VETNRSEKVKIVLASGWHFKAKRTVVAFEGSDVVEVVVETKDVLDMLLSGSALLIAVELPATTLTHP